VHEIGRKKREGALETKVRGCCFEWRCPTLPKGVRSLCDIEKTEAFQQQASTMRLVNRTENRENVIDLDQTAGLTHP
jgi:hypothetical protein